MARLLHRLCLYPCGVLCAIIASFIGFFSAHPIPEGRAFATLIPLFGGYPPATIFGDGYYRSRSPVPVVPFGSKPAARPADEVTRALLGSGDEMPAVGLGLCCRPTAYDAFSVTRSVLWFLLKGGRHLDVRVGPGSQPLSTSWGAFERRPRLASDLSSRTRLTPYRRMVV